MELDEKNRLLERTENAEQRHEQLEKALGELAELQAAQARQEKMVAAIIHQRDVYKELFQSGTVDGTTGMTGNVGNSEAVGGSNALAVVQSGDQSGGERLVVSRQEYGALRQRASEFDQFKAELKEELRDQREKLEKAQASEAATRTQLGTAQAMLAHKAQKLDEKGNELLMKKGELHRSEEKSSQLKKNVEDLQELLESKQSEVEAITEKVAALQADIVRANSDRDIALINAKYAETERAEKAKEASSNARLAERRLERQKVLENELKRYEEVIKAEKVRHQDMKDQAKVNEESHRSEKVRA
eukprot:SAG31_NODE_1499_length_8091_cov_2.089590_2_plen_303_part_00